MRGRAGRNGGDAAVYGDSGDLFKVAAFEPEAAEEIEEARTQEDPEVGCEESG